MMKKLFFVILLACCSFLAAGQPAEKPEHPFSVFIQGGPVYNLYENAFSFWDNGKAWDLLTSQIVAGVGYDFSSYWGLRLQVGYGSDKGGCNVQQTSARGFYPYSFKHWNSFLDVMMVPFGRKDGYARFITKLFAGVGLAHTFGFTDSGHPWQVPVGKNTAFGFRGGIIEEFAVTPWFGIYVDICGEAYTDSYNGLNPSAEKENYQGYPGFPLDLRGSISLGTILRF